MPETVRDDHNPGWGKQTESHDQYPSDGQIESDLGLGFGGHTPDLKKDFDAGLSTASHSQPDYSQSLPKYKMKQTNRMILSEDTEMNQIGPETLSRRLSPQSDSTSELLAQRLQRTDDLMDISPLEFAKKMTPGVENVITLPEIPRRDQQKVT